MYGGVLQSDEWVAWGASINGGNIESQLCLCQYCLLTLRHMIAMISPGDVAISRIRRGVEGVVGCGDEPSYTIGAILMCLRIQI